jgi:hypothetical protein
MVRSASRTRVLVAASIAAACLLIALRSTRIVTRDPRRASEPAGIEFLPAIQAPEAHASARPEQTTTSEADREPLAEHASSRLARESSRDETVLHVQVLDPSRAAVTAGLLEWYAGELQFPETQEGGLHSSTPIRGSFTDLSLPSTCSEAVLIASAASGPATLQRVECLRGAGPDWRPSGFVEHDVTIVLERDPSLSIVHGSIYADSVRRVPSGLKVLLQYDSNVAGATLEELLLRQPRLAAIDPVRSEYAVGPLTPAATALWVTSDETIPRWIPLDASTDAEDIQLDLHCEAGRTLHLTCIDERSGLAASDACIGTETLVAVSTTERKVSSRAYSATYHADGNGECVISGLPSRGTFRVTECPSREVDSDKEHSRIRIRSTILLEIDLEPDLPREIWRELRLASAGADLSRVWGDESALEARFGPSLEVCFAPTRTLHERSTLRTADLSSTGWEARVRAPDDYAFWIESGGKRRSEIESLWISASQDVGPITFTPRQSSAARFAWTDAPVGSRMTLTMLNAKGSESLADLTLADSEGELELEVESSCELNLTLHGSGADELQRRFEWDPAHEPVLAVDMHGSQARRLGLEIEGVYRHGNEELILFGLDCLSGERPVRAFSTLHDGVSSGSLALPPGEYFYRLLGSGSECIAGTAKLGVLDASAELTIAWKGHRRNLEDLPPNSSGGLILESVGGIELSVLVPEELRVFAISTSGEAPPLFPEAFTYRAYRR